MKIGILTFHYAYNYGALMQAWALKEFLTLNGYEVDFVNHKNENVVKSYCIYDARYLRSDSKLAFIIKLLLYPLKVILRLIKYKKFESFISKEIPENDNVDDISTYDVLIVGSDQVWNYELTGGFDDFYWGKIRNHDNQRYIAYAVSMNLYHLDHKEEIRNLLANFYHISVREQNLVDLLSTLTPKHIALVSDPTLLINKDTWEKLIVTKHVPKKNYILSYPIRDAKNVNYIVRQISNKERKPYYIIRGEAYLKFSSVEKNMESPYGFISLIANADMIITSSFHGTILSIIFNKQFYTIRCKDKNNVRVESLLNMLGLNNRLVSSYEEIVSKNIPIDYESVNLRLKDLKKISVDYLLTSIGNE